MEDVQAWVREERERGRTATDRQGLTRTDTGAPGRARVDRSVGVGGSPCGSVSSAQLVANGALSLLNLDCRLLERQLAAQAEAFEKEGGFTERLYRVRSQRRRRSSGED